MNRRQLIVIGLMVKALWATPSVLLAEESEQRGPPDRPVFFQVRYTPSHLFRADYRDADGSFAARHHDVSGTLVFPIPDRGMFNLTLSRDRHQYRFSGNALLDGVLEDAYSTRLTAVYMGALPGDWSLFAMGAVQATAEKGASKSDARSESGQVNVQYAFHERFQLGVGVLAASRLDGSNQAFPIGSINWDITDRWALRTTRGLHLLYTLDAAGVWKVGLNTEYYSRRIRLSDRHDITDGVFRSRSAVSTLSLLYRPNPGVTMGAEMGYAFWRSIDFRDADGERVFRSETDAAPTAAFTASITF